LINAEQIFDELVVAILRNPTKDPLFICMSGGTCWKLDGELQGMCGWTCFDGLTVD